MIGNSLSVPSGLGAAFNQLLFVGRNLDFQSTSDQGLIKIPFGTLFLPTHVYAVRKTGGATVACSGGIYTAAAKGGTAVVAAAQSWLGVTGTNGLQIATVATLTAAVSSLSLFFSLTTGSTAAVTGDVFVFGVVLD